ncbi:4Fe-4S double cluster binding domain-containing protein [Thermodesulfobacteriota bacterium]
MNEALKQSTMEWLNGRVDAVGFAPIDRFDEAPEVHHPSRICKDAKTVIVFGKTVPRGMLHSPDYSLYMLHRTYHSVYEYLNELGLMLANRIEAQGDFLAVPIPSFAPMVYHELEPWGILSLKHAAVKAGLGSFGKNGLMHNPKFGTLLRPGAVVTSAEFEGDPIIEEDPCPEKCDACFKACPSKALNKDGPFKKMDCLRYLVKHAIYPLALKSEKGLKNIERVVNTAGYNYWLTCNECLRVCPSNRLRKS